MTDNKHYQGYTNWESFEFSVTWNNDEGMYDDFVEKAAGGWLEHKGDPVEIGRVIVGYAREHYTGAGEGANDWYFKGLETDAEWEAIDLVEVGNEVRTAMECHGRYAHLLEDEDN